MSEYGRWVCTTRDYAFLGPREMPFGMSLGDGGGWVISKGLTDEIVVEDLFDEQVSFKFVADTTVDKREPNHSIEIMEPSSATSAIQKRESAMKKRLGEGLFTNIALGLPETVRKDVREYELTGEAQTEGATMAELDPDIVAQLLDRLSGEGESEEPTMFSPGTGANFPDIAPPTFTRLPGVTFLRPNTSVNLTPPAPFAVPEPGQLMLTKRESRPLGTLRRGDAWLNADDVKKSAKTSIFKDVVQPTSTTEPQIFGEE